MSEQLDETQIEALFAGEESPGQQAATPVQPRRWHVRKVDFSRPSTFSKEQELLGSARLTADEVRGLRDGAVVVLDRAVDDPNDEWAVLIEEIAPHNEDATAEAEKSLQEEMKTDSADESVDDTEGSG